MKKFISLILIFVLVISLGVSAYAVNFELVVGEDVGSRGIFTVSSGEVIDTTAITPPSGIPDGLHLEFDSSNIYLCGTPTAAGIFSFVLTFNVIDANNMVTTRNVDVNITVSAEPIIVTPSPTPSTEISVTKNPGAENRTVGGTAIFIVKATGASKATWTMVAPDGGQYSLDTFKTKFPGLAVTTEDDTTDGVFSSTIYIANLSNDVSGYSAFATFSNDYGTTAVTSSAGITVTAASPSPTVTPATTPSPVPSSTPLPTIAPTVAPTESPIETIAPVISTDDDVISHRSGNGGTIFVTVLVGLLTIAIATILILYVQGKIDLSWLENILESKTDKSSKNRDSQSDDDDINNK